MLLRNNLLGGATDLGAHLVDVGGGEPFGIVGAQGQADGIGGRELVLKIKAGLCDLADFGQVIRVEADAGG